jgi:hypothetical protein
MGIATKAGLNDQFLPSLSSGARVSAQSLQVLVKRADLDKGRRNDGLASEELRQPRRKVRALQPCVAGAATSHASVLPHSEVRFPPSSAAMPVDATHVGPAPAPDTPPQPSGADRDDRL